MPFIKLVIPPPTSPSTQSSALSFPPSTPPLSISSSTPSANQSQSSYEESEPDQEEESDPIDKESEQEVFYVSRIIARSIPSDDIQYYLVRWWDYGPTEDTWQPSWDLRRTAGKMVDQFDKQEHPFTILDSQDNKLRIRYGWSSRQQGYSPHAEVVWQTREEMGLMGISMESVQAAEEIWKAGMHPNPSLPIAPPQPKKTRSKGVRPPKKGWKLLAIIEETIGTKGNPAKCLVEFKKGRAKPGVQWFSRSYASVLFGKEQMDAARMKQEPEPEVEDTPTMYEDERARNIAENKAILANLGL